MWGTRCGRGVAAFAAITELGYVWGDTQGMFLLSAATGAFCHAPCPGSSTTAPMGWTWPLMTHKAGHTARHRAKGGGMVLHSSLIATVRKENEELWELWCESSIMSVRISSLVWLTWELRRYKVCLKLFSRCPMKTHLHLDCLGFHSQKGLCLRLQGRCTCVWANYLSKSWCHLCQTEWVKIQHSVCWTVEEEMIFTKHKDVNFS